MNKKLYEIRVSTSPCKKFQRTQVHPNLFSRGLLTENACQCENCLAQCFSVDKVLAKKLYFIVSQQGLEMQGQEFAHLDVIWSKWRLRSSGSAASEGNNKVQLCLSPYGSLLCYPCFTSKGTPTEKEQQSIKKKRNALRCPSSARSEKCQMSLPTPLKKS